MSPRSLLATVRCSGSLPRDLRRRRYQRRRTRRKRRTRAMPATPPMTPPTTCCWTGERPELLVELVFGPATAVEEAVEVGEVVKKGEEVGFVPECVVGVPKLEAVGAATL